MFIFLCLSLSVFWIMHKSIILTVSTIEVNWNYKIFDAHLWYFIKRFHWNCVLIRNVFQLTATVCFMCDRKITQKLSSAQLRRIESCQLCFFHFRTISCLLLCSSFVSLWIILWFSISCWIETLSPFMDLCICDVRYARLRHTTTTTTHLLIFWIALRMLALKQAHESMKHPFHFMFSVDSQCQIQWRECPFSGIRAHDTYIMNSWMFVCVASVDIEKRWNGGEQRHCHQRPCYTSSARVHTFIHTHTHPRIHTNSDIQLKERVEKRWWKICLPASAASRLCLLDERSYIFTWCFACERFWRVNN